MGVVVSIHEDVLATGVPVEVAKEGYFPFLAESLGHALDGEYHGMKHLAWLFVPSVEIASTQRAPVVPIYYPIRVYHRHYLEHEFLS